MANPKSEIIIVAQPKVPDLKAVTLMIDRPVQGTVMVFGNSAMLSRPELLLGAHVSSRMMLCALAIEVAQ